MPGPMIGPGPAVDPSAVVTGSSLGESVWIGPRALVVDSDLEGFARINAGAILQHADLSRFASVSAHARIGPTPHPWDRAAQHGFTYASSLYFEEPDDSAFFEARGTVRTRLGPDSLVGHGAIVLPGREVAAGAVVGAGAVVAEDVPAFAVVAGNPARFIRYRFPEDVRAALLRLAWWNWPRARLREALADFRNLSAADFCRRHGAL